MRDVFAAVLIVVMGELIVGFASSFLGWTLAMDYVSEHAQTGIPIETDNKFYKVIPYKLEH